MHFVKAKGILSSKNGMNLYRGCSHGCIYCDSRSRCYHMDHAFEDIEVKENAVELLEYALKHKRKKCMIGTGAMTDPYIPLEMEIGNVRKALKLICEYGFGFTVITKSDRILRDLDLLLKINVCGGGSLWGDLFRHGIDAQGGEQGIFLCATGSPVSAAEGEIHTNVRKPVCDR